MVNNVLVVPFDGEIEHEPLDGGRFITKFKALEVMADANR